MTRHFTYSAPLGDLQQGDVLKRTENVERLLKEVHPHYMNADYRHLLVLTQTCDLVRRREASCKARYISVAAVRPLSTCLTREAQKYQRSERDSRLHVAREKDRHRLVEFTERLMNNNAEGYFYLHPDGFAAISEPMVAFLALSIAIKTELHYQTCLEARVAQLKPEFQAKLGWLVGNMYSRVGTIDWVPENARAEDFSEMVNDLVDGLGITWLPDKILDAVRKADRKAQKERAEGGLRPEEVTDVVESKLKASETTRQQVFARIASITAEFMQLDASKARKFANRLSNDPQLSRLMRK